MKKVFIVAAKRTPMGSFQGALSSVSATELGAVVIKSVLDTANLHPEFVDEVYFGNVLSAGVGQAPARQAALKGGILNDTPCTTVNKVCASGLKSVMLASQQIRTGDSSILIAGGMESMSNTPHYLHVRNGQKLGHLQAMDGMIHDGLTDAFKQKHMGVSAELCAKTFNISREEQDQYAVKSYQRSKESWEKGKFNAEIVPVVIAGRKGKISSVYIDEEFSKVDYKKIPKLNPVFDKEGSVTAANASTLNDGAAALILVSEEKLTDYNLTPIAEIVAYGDAAQEPEWFTTAPAKVIPKVLKKAGLNLNDIDFFEINEAFSVVALANIKALKLDHRKVNVYGGAVALGHPLGCSGARILTTLINILHQENGTYGMAAICNGGGGASAMIIKKL